MTEQDVQKINELVHALAPIIEERNYSGGVRVSALCFLLADLVAYYEAPKKDVMKLFSELHKTFDMQYESEENICH